MARLLQPVRIAPHRTDAPSKSDPLKLVAIYNIAKNHDFCKSVFNSTLNKLSNSCYTIRTMPDFLFEHQPYRPDNLIERVKVPDTIRTPKTDDELVSAARYAYQAAKGAPQILPPDYVELENFFLRQYERGYEERKGIDIVPNDLDLLFQQYAVRMDETLGRNGFNTFGMAVLSYMDGLATVRDGSKRYFGAKENPRDRKQYRALLLGCSSMSSAAEFAAFVHSLNPQATAIVTDLDPLAVKLARETGATVVQADVQRIPLENASIDFVATNFLVPNLIDRFGSGKETVQQVLKEVARVMTPEGRLVMVEQLARNNLEWLAHYASNADLALDTGGILNEAIILPKRSHIKYVLDDTPEFIQSEESYTGKPMSTNYKYGRLHGITSLVFKESQWSKRKGWKTVDKVVVRSRD